MEFIEDLVISKNELLSYSEQIPTLNVGMEQEVSYAEGQCCVNTKLSLTKRDLTEVLSGQWI